jgi:L-ascorbate metabolism protein UlaG (beta-lactamase superfamily)
MKGRIEMKKYIVGVLIIQTLVQGQTLCRSEDTNTVSMEQLEAVVEKITWIEQATMRIQTDTKTFYIDPYLIKKNDEADIILITHSHSDHLSPTDIAKVITDNTLFIATADCASTMQQQFNKQIVTLEPCMKLKIGTIKIEAVPAYNIKTQHHPKANKWVGYILTIDGIRIYHAGDTGLIPEMKQVDCDIVLLPIHRPYSFNSFEDTVQAVLDCKAEIVIPIHYGYNCGDPQDAVRLKQALNGKCRVIIKERGE